jgi:class 3 adenylate cyclase
VTFLFTDVEGSTRLLNEVGETEYARLLDAHRRAIRDAVAQHRGVEVDTQGDAFFCAFDDEREAVAAACDAQEALRRGSVSVRMGLHTGTPIVTDEGYIGREVHLGAGGPPRGADRRVGPRWPGAAVAGHTGVGRCRRDGSR